MQTRFVLLAVGEDAQLYQQAHGACLSLLAHLPPGSEIVVFTNRPDRFRWLAPRLRIEAVGPELLRSWQGPHGYFYRAKFEAVRRALEFGRCHLVLLDADILVIRALDPLIAALDRGAFLMHEIEKALQDRKGTREALGPLFGRRFAGTLVDAKTMVFNSGVVGIPAGREEVVEQALRCNDAMLEAGAEYFALEQLAWSAVLSASGQVELASPFILHYWGNKRAFLKVVNQVLAEARMADWTVEEAAAQMGKRPDLPLRVKDRWWHPAVARLLKLPGS